MTEQHELGGEQKNDARLTEDGREPVLIEKKGSLAIRFAGFLIPGHPDFNCGLEFVFMRAGKRPAASE